MISISYAITVHDEEKEIKTLLPFLLENKRSEDDIIVLFDNKGPETVLHYLQSLYPQIKLLSDKFKNNFAEWKNLIISKSNKDYLFFIDADEMPSKTLLNNLPLILEQNKVELIGVSRVNIVNGITPQHINKWGWRIDEKNRINFPDTQFRIIANNKNIKWKNAVHEIPDGYKTLSFLPQEEEWSLIHIKDITKQEKQNELYNTI
jgi:hypothetical protein